MADSRGSLGALGHSQGKAQEGKCNATLLLAVPICEHQHSDECQAGFDTHALSGDTIHGDPE